MSHADVVRKVLGESGAGKIGNYDFCSFSPKEFTASAVGGKVFEKFDSAILASAKSLLSLENENASIGDPTENRTLIPSLRRMCPNR